MKNISTTKFLIFILTRNMSLKVSKCIVVTVSTICCMFQLQSTLVSYFRYGTISRIEFVGTDILELMSLSLCVPYFPILNFKYIKRIFGINLKDASCSSCNEYNRKRDIVEEKITIRGIFDATPNSESLITYCSMMSESSRYFSRSTDSVRCNELFRIKKYYTQEFVCYAFHPQQFQVPTLNYFTATDSPGIIYTIGINNSFASRMKYYKFIVHSRKSLPRRSKQFSELRRTVDPTRKWYNIRFSRYFIHSLGYPYNGFICSDDPLSYEECIENCVLNQTIHHYHRVAYDLDLEHPYDYSPITRSQIMNASLSDHLDRIVSTCFNNHCKLRPCHIDYTSTFTGNDEDSDVLILLKTPSASDISTTYLPSIHFLDFFVYVMGAIGTWFGFAFIQLDPIAIYSFTKNGLKRLTSNPSNNTNSANFSLHYSSHSERIQWRRQVGNK